MTRQAVDRWDTVPRRAQYVVDLAFLSLAFGLSYLLRFDFAIPVDERGFLVTQVGYVVLLQVVGLQLAGVYSFIWRYVGLRDLRAFLMALAGAAVPAIAFRFALPDSWHAFRIPLSVTAMDFVLALGGVVALRLARRVQYERAQRASHAAESATDRKDAVLLIGAGQAGVMVAKEIDGRGDLALDIRGFVDDDESKRGLVILGHRVLGTTSELPVFVRRLEIDRAVITIAQAQRLQIRRIVEICDSIPVRVEIIPGLFEILEGRVEISRLRSVEIEDLLGREQIKLDETDLVGFLGGHVVMVTGAGGSIGSELARQVARFGPSRLLLVERAEFALFDIERELREAWPGQAIEPLVADIGDESRMRGIFQLWQPAVVVHAAAHKHVPLMEQNPCEAVKNNTLATGVLGNIAAESGAEAFVMISTDKAVRPTSIMGASKRAAELSIQDLARRKPATRFVVVRFGNVMGSTGSVIPIFREQIRRGGPVTVTHPDMVRFFMTIPEAAQLVLRAGAMGRGGEIFVLDMGEPVKIVDLAREMIRLSGLTPGEDIDIAFTGVRPGEKLYEELGHAHETLTKTRHPKIFIGDLAPMEPGALERALAGLGQAARAGDGAAVRERFRELIVEHRL